MSGRGAALVLACASAAIPAPGTDRPAIFLDLCLTAGELVLVDATDPEQERLLADAVCGLVAPLAGRIAFLGRDWQEQTIEYANALRGRIGHVFRSGGWLPYLSVNDNVLLQQLHHTRRRYAELRDQAAQLASRFGLPGLPMERPAELPAADLQRAACVRAFLGTPSLVIVESGATVSEGLLVPLVETMREARDRDTAILWLVDQPWLLRDAALPATRRLRLRGRELVDAALVA